MGRPVENTGHDAQAHREAARRWYQRLSRPQRREYASRRDQGAQREADNRRYRNSQQLRDVARADRADPVKESARAKAADIPIPPGTRCADCGAVKNLERHHPDHSKPSQVRILCSTCNQRAESSYKGVRND